MADETGIVWDDEEDIVWDEPEKKTSLKNTMDRLATGFMDPVYGAAQLVRAGVEKATGKESGYFKESIKKREEDYKKQHDVKGMDWTRIGGSMLNPATVLGPGKTKIAGEIVKGGSKALAKHAGIGAVAGLAMPAAEEGFWRNKALQAGAGGAGGAVGAGIGAGLDNVLRQFKTRVSDPSGQATRHLKKLFEGREDEVANKLDSLRSGVAGEKPTASWLSAEDPSLPQFAAMEREARGGQQAGAFNMRDQHNQAAQLRILDDMMIGGNRPLDELGNKTNSSIMSRAQRTAGPDYDDAAKEMIEVTDPVEQAMLGSKVAAALRDGKEVISQGKLNADAGFTSRKPAPDRIPGRMTGGPTEGSVMHLLGGNTPEPQWINTKNSIGNLQNIRQGMDALIRDSKNSVSAIDKTTARELGDVRKGITDLMRQESPTFNKAENLFADEMIPQNQADYASVLRNSFDQPGGLNQIGLLNALRNPDKTATKAKLPFDVDSTEKVMDIGVNAAKNMKNLQALDDAASRDIAAQAIYAPQKVAEKMGNFGDDLQAVLPPLLSTNITIIKKVADTLGKKLTGNARKLLDEAMLEPAKLAELLRAANPEDRNMIVNAMRAMSGQGVRPVTGALRTESSRLVGGL